MLAAVVLASLWAQAEQAPPPPAPPPPPLAPVLVPPNSLRVHGTFAYRVDRGSSAAPDLGPHAGFSLGLMYERRYLAVSGGKGELGVAIDAAYSRFATSGQPSPVPEMNYDTKRLQTQTSFALMQTAGCPVGRVHPFAALGAGVTIGYFSTPEVDLRPGSAQATMPLVRALAGVDIVISPAASLTIRASYSHAFSRPTFTTEMGTTFTLFGSLLDVGAGMAVRF